ncbi:MAG: hypothetical protein H7Z40_18870 [Phycisphaerae bacterium]|nr:hypothetical protein [Gemmatimonadaceae bacterium]
MSACNVLSQYGIPYTLTSQHTQRLDSAGFRRDLRDFAATCRVVGGLRNARIGAIGARPAAFKTVRFSEKILGASGISVEPIDLSEILGRIERLQDDDADVAAKIAEMQAYVSTEGIPASALTKMAKLGLVIDRWMKEVDVTVSAVQCWTAMEEYFGVVPCTVMSMMSNENTPSACEVDVMGTISMLALTLASETPSALSTFGGAGVVEIPQLQQLLKFICRKGFEHHVAGKFLHVAGAVHEATTRYLGWDVLWHGE